MEVVSIFGFFWMGENALMGRYRNQRLRNFQIFVSSCFCSMIHVLKTYVKSDAVVCLVMMIEKR